MARGQVEILFPLAEVTDPSTRAVYVDGMSNTLYGPGPTLGTTAPGARPHQIATDTLLTPPGGGGGGGGSSVFDVLVTEAGSADDTTRGFTNKIYFEFTVNSLAGTFFSAPGEIQWGFCTSAFNVNDPSFSGDGGDGGNPDIGLPLGFDTNSIGLYDAASFGSGYAPFGGPLVQFGTGIDYALGHTYGVLVDIAAQTFVYRDNTILLEGEPGVYEAPPYGFAGSIVYDISPFSNQAFRIAFSMCYKGGINKLTLNPGDSDWVLDPPPGSTPWDNTGSTHFGVFGPGLTVTGHSVSAATPDDNAIIYGAFTNTFYHFH